MGPPLRIDPTTHRTMSERSYHGAKSRSVLPSKNIYVYMLYNRISIITNNLCEAFFNQIVMVVQRFYFKFNGYHFEKIFKFQVIYP